MDILNIWLANINEPGTIAHKLRQYIVKEDWLEANVHWTKSSRNQFLASRAVFREIVSRYLKTKQPKLANKESIGTYVPSLGKTNGLYFSIAHSDKKMLVAISRTRRIGVDVERIRSIPNLGELCSRLGINTKNSFDNQPTCRKLLLLLQFWTDIEAIAKSKGIGVFKELSTSFDSSRLLNRPKWIKLDKHLLLSVPFSPHYIASLAVEGHNEIDMNIINWS
ncbi:MAG: hypothetical protein AAB499_01805 [Patescibacteria group bacterium]